MHPVLPVHSNGSPATEAGAQPAGLPGEQARGSVAYGQKVAGAGLQMQLVALPPNSMRRQVDTVQFTLVWTKLVPMLPLT